MASGTFLRWKAQVTLLRFQSLSTISRISNRGAQTNAENDDKNLEDIDIEIEQQWAEEEEHARLKQLQNVSGLPPKYFQQLHGEVVEPPFLDLQRRQKMYMTYGSRSGQDPRLLWPSRQEVARLQREEEEDEVPLMEKIKLMRQEQDEMIITRAEHHKSVEKNMQQMNKWIAEYRKKVADAELDIQKRKEKKDALLDEARDFFGYRVKANDPKFQQMVEEKQERERKETREMKKKEKARKLAERLEQDVMAMKLNSASKSEQGETEKSS